MTEYDQKRISLDTSMFALSNELDFLNSSAGVLNNEDRKFLNELAARLNNICFKLGQISAV